MYVYYILLNYFRKGTEYMDHSLWKISTTTWENLENGDNIISGLPH